MEFKYKVQIETGEKRQGIIKAETKEDAIKMLQSKDFYIISIVATGEEKTEKGLKREIYISFLNRISQREVAIFTRQLAIMTKANVSLSESLNALAEQTKNRKLKEQILSIREEIAEGNLFSQALAKFPKTFPPLYINLIATGETIGRLADSLLYLANYLDKEIKLKSDIKSALLYPIFVIIFAIIAGIVAIVRIIPGIKKGFVGLDLPWQTRALIQFSDALTTYGILILLLLILFCCLISIFFKTSKGRILKESIVLSLPIISPFLIKIYTTRFCQSLSVLISSGVPIIQALEVSSKTTNSLIYERMILESSENIKKGGLLNAYYKRHPKYFPVVFTQILAVGEQAGEMDKSLMDIEEYYKREVEVAAKNFMELLTPILITILGMGVGFLMWAIWTPMFQAMDPALLVE
jgi:type IV pilus assembly protein PilC